MTRPPSSTSGPRASTPISSGSPTAGTGKYYAEAAWNNGVDPRWAPAISMIESTKGAACFRSHNAWGFGSSGYSSWQEGINAVVSTLGSSMYGGYLTRDAAAKYCPPTADEWYSNVSAQMAIVQERAARTPTAHDTQRGSVSRWNRPPFCVWTGFWAMRFPSRTCP